MPEVPPEHSDSCPFCGAARGEMCRTGRGEPAVRTHSDRTFGGTVQTPADSQPRSLALSSSAIASKPDRGALHVALIILLWPVALIGAIAGFNALTGTQDTDKPTPFADLDVVYANCDAVRAAEADPIYPGDPGFEPKFDRDTDGIGCE